MKPFALLAALLVLAPAGEPSAADLEVERIALGSPRELKPLTNIWNFQDGDGGWQADEKGCEVVAGPGNESDRAFQILATRPHHTRVNLPGSEKSPDILLSFRYRVLDSTGSRPTIYLYGRSAKGGFRGLALTPSDGAGSSASSISPASAVPAARVCSPIFITSMSLPSAPPASRDRDLSARSRMCWFGAARSPTT